MQTPSFSVPLYLAMTFLLGFFNLITARPADIYTPPLIHPSRGTVWKAGERYNVTWDTSSPPKQITNRSGRVVLARNGWEDYEHPLAQGFDIMTGRVEVAVPKDTKPDTTYQVVLFGDSGNMSQKFTITE